MLFHYVDDDWNEQCEMIRSKETRTGIFNELVINLWRYNADAREIAAQDFTNISAFHYAERGLLNGSWYELEPDKDYLDLFFLLQNSGNHSTDSAIANQMQRIYDHLRDYVKKTHPAEYAKRVLAERDRKKGLSAAIRGIDAV